MVLNVLMVHYVLQDVGWGGAAAFGIHGVGVALRESVTQRVGVDAAGVVVDEVAVHSSHSAGKRRLLLHCGNQFADSS